jgi:DNA polymerase-1
MTETKHTAYLIDGSGYIFRAFYGVAPLSTKDGFPTNALYGFVRMLFKTLTLAGSERVAVVFDAGKKTFRNDLDPEYKANRSECPPELLKQMPHFSELCSALGVTVLQQQGYEADDIIGTLVEKLATDDTEVVVVSGDKDLMQLVTSRVTIWDTMKDQRFGIPQVIEKFGVPPEKVVEILALTGDASDNVAGIDGVGPKTAAQLIEKYQSVEGVIASTAAIKEDSSIRNRKKIAEAIESNPERLRLSRRLVEIDRKVPLEGPLGGDVGKLDNMDELLTRRELDGAHLGALFDRFEFSTLLKEFPKVVSKRSTTDAQKDFVYKTVRRADFADWLLQFLKQDQFSFDTETTSLAIHEAKIVGLSFCWHNSEAYYIPLGHTQSPEEQVSWSEFKAGVAAHFANASVKKSGQNIKYDISVLELNGIHVAGVDFDSMVAAYLLNPDSRTFNLTALANDFLSLPVIEFEEVTAGAKDFSDVALEPATRYAAQDAHYAWLLKGVLLPRIEEEGLLKVLHELEVPLIPVLASMERSGVGVDVETLRKMSAEFQAQLLILETQIYTCAGQEFNINSTKQLAEILFVKLGIPTKGLKKTKTGISTDSSVLERLADQHPLPQLILEYRLLHKLKSTYTDALVEDISPITGRVHTKLNQTITGTGRLSSSDPNLQNIPIQSVEGRRIRSAFIPAPGKILISADYSQIELRLLAHMSDDANLIRAFRDGVDIHASTAREIMGLAVHEEVPDDVRRIGKTINFGIVYGMGAFRLSRELGIPVSQASNYINNYFDRYPRVREYFKRLEEEATANGFVQTIFGRKRVIGSIDTGGRDQGFAMRAAINAPIQGSAADIIKLAMIKVAELLKTLSYDASLVLQIHDELLVECSDRGEADNKNAMNLLTTTMEEVLQLSVPLRVEAGMGYTWQEAQS